MGGENQRRTVRVPKLLDVQYSANCPPIRARSQDLSETGLFLETHHPLTVGTLIELRFSLPDGREAVLQHLTGGSMSRIRPHSGQPTSSLSPGASATFAYRFPSSVREPARASVRLLFRTMPPYFLKALAAEQRSGDGPNLGPLVTNLEVTEMAAISTELASF